MKNNKYWLGLIQLIKEQKILFAIGVIIVVMLSGVVLITNDNKSQTRTPTQSQSVNQALPATAETTSSSSSPTNPTLLTRFFYFVGGFFNKPTSPTNQYNNASRQYSGSQSQSQSKTTSIQQNTTPQSPNQSGNSGSGASSGTNSSQGNGNSQQSNNLQPTPTPVTNINIVFINDNGEYWTYVPPGIPPIDVTWMRYINYQDHYAIDYPSNWQLIKSNYNGHESITLYMPDDSSSIDKPSIAFVGWQANYLGSSAKYTGNIILNGTQGTIYTNGPLGLSSVATVFQYANGFFALGSSTTNTAFIYVFDHMLRSISFSV